MLSFKNLDVIFCVFELKPDRIGHFAESSILIEEPGIVLEGKFELDSGIIVLHSGCQFARYVCIAIVLSGLTLVRRCILLFLGSALL